MPMRDEIPSGLKPGTARILVEIALADDELAVGALSTRLRLPLPRISRLLGELEDLALIERARDPADRRRVCVRASPAGKRAADGLRRAHRERLTHLLDALGSRDTEQLLKIFERASKRLAPSSVREPGRESAPVSRRKSSRARDSSGPSRSSRRRGALR
jgi:DNA-binding MarR family transcriptional regulator